ncbi:hypothetical protein [Burkholderia ubonensis]|uniref:hypothetical protein n=1 Tax=Burkholderia ubonensis TaxID=101571 RepID=UPI0012F77BD5|nr:hypothetical protein [Burkholderia ubonensis]
MLIATDYEILRAVPADGRSRGIPVARRPVRVATLLNEARFIDAGAALIHHDTVFLEDRIHDWDYRDGHFRYYTRVAQVADVVLVFAERKIAGFFCPDCGKRVHPVNECQCHQKA